MSHAKEGTRATVIVLVLAAVATFWFLSGRKIYQDVKSGKVDLTR